MKETPQKRAIKNYRDRLSQQGLARFEVLGLDKDRDLIRSVAKRLSEDSPAANQFRAAIRRSIAGEARRKGGILAALRRSPLVDAELEIVRPVIHGRKVDV